MNESIEFSIYPSSFSRRSIRYFAFWILISTVFFIIPWNSARIFDPTVSIICSFVFGLYYAYHIWKGRYYLHKITLNADKAEIHYLDKSIGRSAVTPLSHLNVRLKNTSSRSGFNCELVLETDSMLFTLNGDFDWTLSEIGMLFEQVRALQEKPLTYEEKFTLKKIAEKEKLKLKRTRKYP